MSFSTNGLLFIANGINYAAFDLEPADL